MAKVLFGGGVAEMRGRLGGTIFSRNAGGPYAKNMANPTNPQSTKQLAVRAFFSSCATAWQDLTQMQRDAWNAAATTLPFINSIGLPYYLTGKGLYIKSNQVVANVLKNRIDNCPAKFLIPDAPGGISVAADVNGTTFVLTADDANVPADRVFFVDAAPQSAPTVINNNSKYKRIHFIDAAGALDTVDLATVYSAVFGAFQEDQKLEIRCGFIDSTNGMMSSYIKASTIVVDTTP